MFRRANTLKQRLIIVDRNHVSNCHAVENDISGVHNVTGFTSISLINVIILGIRSVCPWPSSFIPFLVTVSCKIAFTTLLSAWIASTPSHHHII